LGNSKLNFEIENILALSVTIFIEKF